MPRPEGSGRQPGSKNKKTILKVTETLTSRDFSPTDKLLDLLPTLEPEDQAKVLMFLISYCEAKPKEETKDDSNLESPNELKDVSNSVLIKFLKSNQKESTDE